MEQIPTLIQDLALILLIAAVVSLLFKWLKQPVVLGYVVAGFIAGPHFIYTPSVHDSGSIDIWAQIGVIILLFTLGLEFSFKKILKMGAAPVIAALTIIFCMMFLGASVGHLFGWKSMDCIYLGGMLAMSSTTIIYKAFQDLGVLQKKFAGVVLSVLILEDILAIVLMVMLSTLAVSHNIEGEELIEGLLRLGFFLILWFVVGLYLIPIILRKNRKFLNSETLLIVSLALCFVMAVVAVESGFSAAFGAFVVGSILAETVEAERIEKLVAPVKDLFGAIFFVSVGMLVDPEVLVEYAWPIAALTLTIIVGQAFFGTFGFVLAGQPLKEAMKCGFSMSQIGEFAFIIASLGMSLGVTSHYLYPIVVAVSVVTTFTTPYMLKASGPAYCWLCRVLPPRLGGVVGTLYAGHGGAESFRKLEEIDFRHVEADCGLHDSFRDGHCAVFPFFVALYPRDTAPLVGECALRSRHAALHRSFFAGYHGTRPPFVFVSGLVEGKPLQPFAVGLYAHCKGGGGLYAHFLYHSLFSAVCRPLVAVVGPVDCRGYLLVQSVASEFHPDGESLYGQSA